MLPSCFRVFGDAAAGYRTWIYAQGCSPSTCSASPKPLQLVQRHDSGRDAAPCSPRCTRLLPSINDLVSRHRELSLEELQAEVDVSIEILHRVIEHFKAQGKQVVVVGHSYGAFLTARYLWRKGPGAADRYLIMAGRLDMQREVVEGVLAGQYYYFPDAVNPAPVPPYPVPITEREILELRIMGATGHDRYTERLAGTDLSRVLYGYGSEDMIVGRLTEDEVGFLTSSGAGSSRSTAATSRCSRTPR